MTTKRMALGLLVAALGLFGPVGTLAAATFTVNSVDDTPDAQAGNGVCATASGACTLRAAIQESNANPGTDTIAFAIGSGAQRITLGAGLPTIADPVVIDGTTQPGYANKPLIEVNGANRRANGLTITSGNTTVRRLLINGFAGDGIMLAGPGGNLIERNYIGTDLPGTSAVPNHGSGVVVDHSPGNTVQYNLISGNDGGGNSGGVLVNASTDTLVQGNLIGTDITGTVRLENHGRGISVKDASNNTFRSNVISGNWGSGFRVYGTATGNLIEGNYIGTSLDARLLNLGNFAGVQIRSNDNVVRLNLIAGNADSGVLLWQGASGNLVQDNIIAYNLQDGIAVFTGTGNRLYGNRIYRNRLLGIELSADLGLDPNALNPSDSPLGDGVDTNDYGDFDTGPNNRQNYPVIDSATFADNRTLVDVTLNTTAGTDAEIEFFVTPACHETGHGQGPYYLGRLAVTTDGAGNVTATMAITMDLRGYWLTTTATTSDGTSEFSACRIVS